jgi:cytochrome P450
MFDLLKLPPIALRGPRALPFLGAAGNLIRFFGDPVGTLRHIHKNFGTLATLADRDPALLCAFGPTHNHQILSDSTLFHNFSELPVRAPKESAPNRLNTALTGMNGDTHKRHRKLLMPLFQRTAVAAHRDDIAAFASKHLDRWRPGESIDLVSEMIELTMGVALRCLFGTEVTGADDLGHLGMSYLEGMISMGAMIFPVRIPGTPYDKFMTTSERFEYKIRSLIEERRRNPTANKDVLSALIEARDDNGVGLTDAELIGQAAVLFIAGHETTAYTLSWTLLLLMQHPKIYGDLLDELSANLHGEAPSAEMAYKIPQLEAVLKESMRLLPATAFLFLRRSTREFQIDSYTLPAGVQIILSSLITHRIPELYREPQRFLPSRWETLQPSPYEYMPFGAGPRLCIGASFASLVLRIVLPLIVQRFRLSLPAGVSVSKKVRGITLGFAGALPVQVHRQDKNFQRATPLRGDIRALVDLPS